MNTSPAALQQHARDLAIAFDVRLVEDARIKPEEAFGVPNRRLVVSAPVTEETTYAVVLHEIGHLVSPTGAVVRTGRAPQVTGGEYLNLMLLEERSAWAWAAHYALDWTPTMAALATYAIGTYERERARAIPPTAPAVDPPAPVAPKSINWQDWK